MNRLAEALRKLLGIHQEEQMPSTEGANSRLAEHIKNREGKVLSDVTIVRRTQQTMKEYTAVSGTENMRRA